MKFLADMGISPRTILRLQSLGFDAIHLRDEGLERLSDREVLEKARLEQRVLLTHDLDFADLIAATGGQLPSVVVFRLRDMQPETVNRHVDRILEQHMESLEKGCIASVTEAQIRIRRLPFRT
jgi:predicted nuclease of predicted toxin-antitoxin system